MRAPDGRVMARFARRRAAMSKAARLCAAMPKAARLCAAMPKAARLCAAMPKAARLCAAMPKAARLCAHGAIRLYQLTLSSLIGRQCRHWPSCSDYTDQAIQRHGLWAGGWMGLARICRCGPFGTHGIDLVPLARPEAARWWRPWCYARWRGVEAPPSPFACEAVDPMSEQGDRTGVTRAR